MTATTEVLAFNKGSGFSRHPGDEAHGRSRCGGNCTCGDAPTPAPPTPEATDAEIRAYLLEGFKRAHPGRPIPQWLTATHGAQATRAAPKPTADRSTVLLRMGETVAEIARIASGLPEPRPVRLYAMPTPVDAALSDDDPDNKSPDGAPHGDSRIMRRRRATELERLLRENRKLARAKAPTAAARAQWDAEYQELSAELAAIREAERNERGEYRKF